MLFGDLSELSKLAMEPALPALIPYKDIILRREQREYVNANLHTMLVRYCKMFNEKINEAFEKDIEAVQLYITGKLDDSSIAEDAKDSEHHAFLLSSTYDSILNMISSLGYPKVQRNVHDRQIIIYLR